MPVSRLLFSLFAPAIISAFIAAFPGEAAASPAEPPGTTDVIAITSAAPIEAPAVVSVPLEGISDVEVTITTRNFLFAEDNEDTPVKNQGRAIYYMDIIPPTGPEGQEFRDKGTSGMIAESSFTWTDVSPGRYVFSVQLVNNDGTPLTPPEIVSADFEVPASVGTAGISSELALEIEDTGAPTITSVTITAS